MNFMMKSYQIKIENKTNLLFAILREALWSSGEDIVLALSAMQAAQIFSQAEKQAVLGLVVDSLFRHDVKMPQQCVFKAVGLIGQIKQQSRIVNDGVVKFDELMSSADINYAIVKGQIVASCYPDPLLRQSGDIDYYCDAKNFPLSQDVIKRCWGIEVEREESDLHVHYDYQKVTYEGHFSLANLYGRKRDQYWQGLINNDRGATIEVGGKPIKTLSPTLHTLYVFIHLYSHLLALGVGLRQFCDLAVMLHYSKDQINMDTFRMHLETLGLERAFMACGSMLVDYLGLPEKELGYTLSEQDRKYAQKVLDVVMYRGNMGHYNKRSGFRGWKHKVEAMGIKLSHFVKFMPLAPGYSCGWMWHEITRQIH